MSLYIVIKIIKTVGIFFAVCQQRFFVGKDFFCNAPFRKFGILHLIQKIDRRAVRSFFDFIVNFVIKLKQTVCKIGNFVVTQIGLADEFFSVHERVHGSILNDNKNKIWTKIVEF